MRFLKIIDSSVAIRTTTIIIMTILVIMLSMGFWQNRHVRYLIEQSMHHRTNQAIDNAVKIIDGRLAEVETAVNTASGYAGLLGLDEPRETDIYKMMEQLISSNGEISAVTMMYRADFFPKHGRYFAPTVYRNLKTKKLEKDEIGGPKNDFCYLETDSNWIYTNKLNSGYWCLPYVDSMSTKRAMMTYSVPLYDKRGDIYAVLCADVDLYWLREIVENAKPYDYSDVIVISRDSQFIAHPDSTWILSKNVFDGDNVRENGGCAGGAVLSLRLKNRPYLSLINHMQRREKGSDTLEAGVYEDLGCSKSEFSGRVITFYAPISRVQWSVSFLFPEEKIMEDANLLSSYLSVILMFMIVLISAVLYFVIKHQLRPLKVLAEDAHQVAKGDFSVQLPTIHSNDEIRNLRDSFSDMTQSLTNYIDQLKETTSQKASMESELRIASDIQMSMLPKKFPPFPERHDIDIYGVLKAAKGVGGDLYDFFIQDERLYFYIGDVSGKGVPAALVMAVTRTQFRIISSHEANPEVIVTTINNIMSADNETNMFVTLFVGVLDLASGRLSYCNAGHDSPLILAKDGVKELPCEPNLPIGVMEDWEFKRQEASLQSSSTIFLYTDGLNEAEDISHAQFGDKRIYREANTLLAEGELHPHEVIDKMTEAVHQFVGDADQSDDLTMLAVYYCP